MFRKTLLLALAMALAASLALAADSPRFRGPQGDGIFAESGLLASWPETGPEVLWAALSRSPAARATIGRIR